MLIKFTYVDAITGIPVTIEPAVNGPVFPEVQDLQYGFAKQSEFPTNTPTFYGECPEQPLVPGILSVITSAEYNQDKDFEDAIYKTTIVPQVISPKQARIVLLRRGILPNIPSIIESLDEPMKSEVGINWEFAGEFRRYDPTLLQLAGALGLDSSALDQLFIEASEI